MRVICTFQLFESFTILSKKEKQTQKSAPIAILYVINAILCIVILFVFSLNFDVIGHEIRFFEKISKILHIL
jgi:hypothetical protein